VSGDQRPDSVERGHRRYGGKTAGERRAERRRALVEAGKTLWRDGGLAAVTIRGVTAQARVTDRYFYEQFTDLSQLLGAVIDDTVEGPVEAMLRAGATPPDADPATRLEAGLAAFIEHSAGDPVVARIFSSDASHLPAVAERTRVLEHRIAAAILYALDPEADPTSDDFDAALFCVGGVSTLIRQWLLNPERTSARVFAGQAVTWCLKVLDPIRER
jgi:AcrR family transcriptional regulator